MDIHQLMKVIRKKSLMHDVYFCDMKAKDFIDILSSVGYGVYIKRNEKDGYISKEVSDFLYEVCNYDVKDEKVLNLCFVWILIKASSIKKFYTESETEMTKEYINQKIDEWIKEISPFIKNLKLGEEKEKTNKNIFHMLQISEQVLPKTLVHTYQKVISNKAIELIGK